MEWNKEASLRLEKIPVFVRRLARSKIEKHASEKGKNVVTVEDVEDAKAGFMGKGSVKSEKGVVNTNPFSLDVKAGEDKFEILKRSDEYEEEDGYPAMYHIDICRGEDVECPFLIAGVKGLLQKIKDRLSEVEFSKKLIKRIDGKDPASPETEDCNRQLSELLFHATDQGFWHSRQGKGVCG